MVMFSYIWLEGLELKHINMSCTFDVQSDTRDSGPDLSRPFLIEKKQKQMVCSCAENSRSWSLWAFCRVGSKPPYIPHVMRNVCLHCMWRSSSSGGSSDVKRVWFRLNTHTGIHELHEWRSVRWSHAECLQESDRLQNAGGAVKTYTVNICIYCTVLLASHCCPSAIFQANC